MATATAPSTKKHPVKFGTDGWRAIMADEFTFANAALVVRAIAAYLTDENGGTTPTQPVLLGYDGRFLGKHFAELAGAVFTELGFNPIIVPRYTPTPIVAFAAKHYQTCGALMFTASHNPPEYMGLKFIPNYAGPATQAITDAIMAHVDRLADTPASFTKPAELDDPLSTIDPTQDYVDYLGNSIQWDVLAKANFNVAYDPMYGAGFGYLDTLITEKTGIKLTTLHNRIDPLFGGCLPEPKGEYLAELIDTVKNGDYKIGLANDGDADRFGVIDSDGTFIGANHMLPMVLRYLYHRRGFRGNTVRSVATSRLLDAMAAKLGITCHETKVGFKHMGAKMREEAIIVGGEEAGGLSIHTHIPEKDGILASLLFLEMLTVEGKTMGEILKDTQAEAGMVLHGIHENLHMSDAAKLSLMNQFKALKAGDIFAGRHIDSIGTLEGIKLFFGEWDWLLIRPSGTEPILRVYGESVDDRFIQQVDTTLTGMIAAASA